MKNTPLFSRPDANNQTAWKFTPIFDFDDANGFWQSVVLVGIHQERKRKDINSLVAARGKGLFDRKKRGGDRVGGEEEEKVKNSYPTGPNLADVERKSGFSHKSLGKNGIALCCNFSAHSGCSRGGYCGFSHAQRIKPDGLRRAAQYDLARRGGLMSQKRLVAGSVEGFIQALRTKHAAEAKQPIDEGRMKAGGKHSRPTSRCIWPAGIVSSVG